MREGFIKLINDRLEFLYEISLFDDISKRHLYLLACHLSEYKYKEVKEINSKLLCTDL